MKRICAWCKKELSPQEDMELEREITHGICSICALKFTSNVQKSAKELLDIISEPVLILDSMGTVITANESGLQLLGKKLGDVENHLGGDALECSYAKLPEGCGKTEHCKTCAIRNVLMGTLAHGRSYNRVPAYQKISTPNGDRIMRFYISSEKMGDQVLLRIDDIDDRISA